jgi:hypothetical protein
MADPSKLVLFTDGTSISIKNPIPSKLIEDINNKIDNMTGSK